MGWKQLGGPPSQEAPHQLPTKISSLEDLYCRGLEAGGGVFVGNPKASKREDRGTFSGNHHPPPVSTEKPSVGEKIMHSKFQKKQTGSEVLFRMHTSCISYLSKSLTFSKLTSVGYETCNYALLRQERKTYDLCQSNGRSQAIQTSFSSSCSKDGR